MFKYLFNKKIILLSLITLFIVFDKAFSDNDCCGSYSEGGCTIAAGYRGCDGIACNLDHCTSVPLKCKDYCQDEDTLNEQACYNPAGNDNNYCYHSFYTECGGTNNCVGSIRKYNYRCQASGYSYCDDYCTHDEQDCSVGFPKCCTGNPDDVCTWTCSGSACGESTLDTCDSSDYCSGSTRYYNEHCSGGSCVWDTQACATDYYCSGNDRRKHACISGVCSSYFVETCSNGVLYCSGDDLRITTGCSGGSCTNTLQDACDDPNYCSASTLYYNEHCVDDGSPACEFDSILCSNGCSSASCIPIAGSTSYSQSSILPTDTITLTATCTDEFSDLSGCYFDGTQGGNDVDAGSLGSPCDTLSGSSDTCSCIVSNSYDGDWNYRVVCIDSVGNNDAGDYNGSAVRVSPSTGTWLQTSSNQWVSIIQGSNANFKQERPTTMNNNNGDQTWTRSIQYSANANADLTKTCEDSNELGCDAGTSGNTHTGTYDVDASSTDNDYFTAIFNNSFSATSCIPAQNTTYGTSYVNGIAYESCTVTTSLEAIDASSGKCLLQDACQGTSIYCGSRNQTINSGGNNNEIFTWSETNVIIPTTATDWIQDTSHTSKAGVRVYISGKGRAIDTDNITWTNVAFNNSVSSEMGRNDWNCLISGTQYIPSIPANGIGTDNDYAVNCTKNVIIANTGQEWQQDTIKTTYAGGVAYIEGKANYTNTDDLINYKNVLNDQDSFTIALSRSGWANCSYKIGTTNRLNYASSSTNVTTNYPIICNKSNVISIINQTYEMKNKTTIYVDEGIVWNVNLTINNTDTINYTNVNVTATNKTIDGIWDNFTLLTDINSGETKEFNFNFTTEGIILITGSLLQGDAEINKEVTWLIGYEWRNLDVRDYNQTIIGVIPISIDLINETLNLTRNGITITPSNINLTGGYIEHNESSIPSESKYVFNLNYNTTAPYINISVVENSTDYIQYVNLTGPTTPYKHVKIYTTIDEDICEIKLFKNISGNWVDITLNQAYSFSKEDTDNNGFPDKLQWYDDTASTNYYKVVATQGLPIQVQCVNENNNWINCDISILGDCPIIHRLTETITGEAIFWSQQCRFYNPNSFGKTITDKFRVISEATSILFDGFSKGLLWDIYGPYIPVADEFVYAGSYKYHNLSFYTPPVFTTKVFNYPDKYYVNENANATVLISLNNYGTKNITIPVIDYENIRHGVNVTLYDNESNIIREYGYEDGTVAFDLGTIDSGETKEFRIEYDILTATSNKVRPSYITRFNNTEYEVTEYDICSIAYESLTKLLWNYELSMDELCLEYNYVIQVDSFTDKPTNDNQLNIVCTTHDSRKTLLVDLGSLDVGGCLKLKFYKKMQPTLPPPEPPTWITNLFNYFIAFIEWFLNLFKIRFMPPTTNITI